MNLKLKNIFTLLLFSIILVNVNAQKTKVNSTSTHITTPIRVNYDKINRTIEIYSIQPKEISKLAIYSNSGELQYYYKGENTDINLFPIYIPTESWNPGIYII